ncbi:MAG: nucleotide exchange factor GrpE [Candidatus Krumholzibacteria bacterium]|nr:nucleotide exchange factor GrpE [Candidatus Krumholzibacteria bacterium]
MTVPGEQELDPRSDDESAETPEEIEDLEEVEEPEEPEEPCLEDVLRAERDAFEGKWLRVVAELDNVRKRSRREVTETRRFTQAEILRSLLEVQDNFERALQSVGDSSDTGESGVFREGVELIFQKFRGVLKDKGVEPMEALGVEFDPNFHEAVGQLPREDTEPGLVIEVVQQGFHFGDMVLRPARVIISS